MSLHLLVTALILLPPSWAKLDTVAFLTRPGQRSVDLRVVYNPSPSELSKDYIFCAPFVHPGPRNQGYPHIYTSQGQLVYHGSDIDLNRSANFHPTEYLGEGPSSHFLFIDALLGRVEDTRKIRIFDSTYSQTGPNYGSINGLRAPDGHTANVPVGQGGTTLLHDVYQPVPHDLRPFGGPKNGWIISGCFQEVFFHNNSLVFQWCSHEHIDPGESYVYFQGSNSSYQRPNAGFGTKAHPWDYLHFNAVQKLPDGNYIVSSRHCSTVYKIAGSGHSKPGSVLWRLGGKKNQFDKSFEFGLQHDARWHPEYFGDDTIGLSIMDNAFDDAGLITNDYSRGMLIRLDEVAMTAQLAVEYPQPERVLAGFGGGVTLLDNENVLVGWGRLPAISEYAKNGTLLFYAKYGAGGWSSYRVFKSPWVGRPKTKPDVLAYSQDCNSRSQYVYVSWNGATEVDHYTVLVGDTKRGPFHQHDTKFLKSGYETQITIHLEQVFKFIKVRAHDSDGKILETSRPRPMFVPREAFASKCGAESCGTDFRYILARSKARFCKTSVPGTETSFPDELPLNMDL